MMMLMMMITPQRHGSLPSHVPGIVRRLQGAGTWPGQCCRVDDDDVDDDDDFDDDVDDNDFDDELHLGPEHQAKDNRGADRDAHTEA